MMTRAFNLEILTPEKNIFAGEVSHVQVPCVNGFLGVLADHAPLITALKSGPIHVTKKSGEGVYFRAKGQGFLEVAQNTAVMLLDAVEDI